VKPTRNPDSALGDWYIDTACIDCGASRHVAPNLIVERHGKSVFARQPTTSEDQLAAWRAVLVCPTASVRSETKQLRPQTAIFPQEITESVWRCGFNARSSFGAHSYFVARSTGNILVDSPRYATELVKWFEDTGGIGHVLLSHRDDVADADKYATRFGARVWIHHDDRSAAPYATDLLEGESTRKIAPGLIAIRCPDIRAAASCTCSTIGCSSPATRSPGACASKTSSPFAMRAGIHGVRPRHRLRNLPLIALSGSCQDTAGRRTWARRT